jgi:hypothetical protein
VKDRRGDDLRLADEVQIDIVDALCQCRHEDRARILHFLPQLPHIGLKTTFSAWICLGW